MARFISTLAALALVLALAAGSASASEQELVIRGNTDGAADPGLAATAPAPLYPYLYNPNDLYAPGALVLVPAVGAPDAAAGGVAAAAVDDDGGARRRLMGRGWALHTFTIGATTGAAKPGRKMLGF